MSTFTTNDGVELSYRDSGGDGFPLVMLHGWGQTQAMFAHQLSGLASEHRRVITLDQRGHGTSAKPAHGYRVARLAQDAAQLMDHLHLGKADVLGWSMGASVLWSYMDQYGTGRIRKFVSTDQPAACAAVPWMTEQEQQESGAIFSVDSLVSLGGAMAGEGGFAATEAFVRGMFSGTPADDVWELVYREIQTVPPSGSVPLIWDHATKDWRDVIKRIDVPTLVIGCDGSFIDPDSQRYVANSIPNAELYIFPTSEASSHFMFLENPTVFNRVVAEFLDK